MALKSKTFSNQLTLEQQERVHLLINSLSATLESCSKVLINGYNYPDNRIRLHANLALLNYCLSLLIKNGDISSEEINDLGKGAGEVFLKENMIHYQPEYTDEM